MIFALWHGGSGYAAGYISDDLEIFASVAACADALRSRARHGSWQRQTFTYADGRTDHTYTPCADYGAAMTVWRYDPRTADDPYPDLLLELGPRGGIQRVPA